jgi:hypothetical protein
MKFGFAIKVDCENLIFFFRMPSKQFKKKFEIDFFCAEWCGLTFWGWKKIVEYFEFGRRTTEKLS